MLDVRIVRELIYLYSNSTWHVVGCAVDLAHEYWNTDMQMRGVDGERKEKINRGVVDYRVMTVTPVSCTLLIYFEITKLSVCWVCAIHTNLHQLNPI